MIDLDTKDPAQILADAKLLQLGESPASATTPHSGDEASGGGAPSGAPSPLAADFLLIGSVVVSLTDMVFLRAFGPHAAMDEPLRGQAAEAWGRVLQHYAPMLGSMGPWGALLTVYGSHVIALQVHAWQTPERSSVPSVTPAAANPHFSEQRPSGFVE
jgi:hypothetical protein